MGLSEIEFLLKGLENLLPLFMPSTVNQKRNCHFKGGPKPSCKGIAVFQMRTVSS